MKKRSGTVSFFTAGLLCLYCAAAHGGVLSDPDTLSQGVKLAFESSEKVLEAKGNAQEGLQSFAYEKMYDLMAWKVGEREKEVFAGLVKEGEWKSYWQGQMNLWKKVYQSTGKALEGIEKICEGNYDEAAISFFYAAAEAVDHPVVKLACAAAVITLESYKQVKDTGAALQIEALYGKVNSDRRLLGAIDPNTDQPAQIEATADNADYFFDRYVMTDEGIRDMVKTYVTKVIGDTWPEQSWSAWLSSWMAVGSGQDTARSAETLTLATEFRDKARAWIMTLIKDVNKQAKVAWAQARLRQNRADFAKYVRSIGLLEGDFSRALQEYESKKELRQQVPKWKQWLAESPAALKKAYELANKPKKLYEARSLYSTWDSRMRESTSGAHVVGEMDLRKSLQAQQQAWWKFEKDLDALLEKQQETVRKDPSLVAEEDGKAIPGDEKGYYNEWFAPLLEPFDEWSPSSPEAVKAVVLDALNGGDFTKSYEKRSEWDNASSKAMEKYFDTDLAEKLKKALEEAKAAPTEKIRALQEEYDRRNAENGSLGQKASAASVTDDESLKQSLASAMRSNYDRMERIKAEIAAIQTDMGEMDSAYWIAEKVRYSLKDFAYNIRGQADKEMQDLQTAFSELKERRITEWYTYLSLFREVQDNMPVDAILGEGTPTAADERYRTYLAPIEEALAAAKAHTFDGIGAFDTAKGVYELLWDMSGRASMIGGGGFDLSNAGPSLSGMEQEFSLWRTAARTLEGLPKLPAQDLNEIKILAQPEGLKESLRDLKALDEAASKLAAFIQKANDKMKELDRVVSEEKTQREEAAAWIKTQSKMVEHFFAEQVAKQVLKLVGGDYEMAIKTESDMILVMKPYKHYLIESEVRSYADGIRQDWEKYSGYRFIKNNAPQVMNMLEGLLKLSKIKPAGEENFVVPSGDSEITIWKSSVDKLSQAADGVKSDASDHEFNIQMMSVTTAVPGAIISSGDNDMPYATDTSYKQNAAAYNHSLGQAYIAVLEKLQKVFDERKKYLAEHKTQGPQGPGGPQDKPGGPGNQPADQPGGPDNQPAGKPKDGQGPGEGPGQPGGNGPAGGAGQGGAGQGAFASPGRSSASSASEEYEIQDPRINSKSVRNLSGEVILTSGDLRSNAVEITGRLNVLDRVDKILVSNDGGRAWEELPKSQSIFYTFVPMSDRIYEVIFRIKTTDYEEVTLEPFRNLSGILYRNIDYTQLVTEFVKSISEAYEAQNFSRFSELVSRDFIGNRVFLEEGVRFDFDMFANIRLTIFINKIQMRENLIIADTKWDKTQLPRGTGEQQKTSGQTTMTFIMEDGRLKIYNLRGNLIYATLSPPIAESSGLSQTVVEEIRQAEEERNPVQPGAGETEDAGGTSMGALLTTRNGSITSAPPPPPDDVHGFDFSNSAEVLVNAGDFNYVNGDTFESVGVSSIQVVTGTYTYDNLTTAPTSGYAAVTPLAVGDVVAFKTAEGFYGKMKVTGITNNPPVNDNIQFQYAVQTDGTTGLRTA